jgi:hypothetical protein
MERQKARRARILFLLWLMVAVLYFNLAVGFVSASMADKEFGEYLQFAVQIVTEQQRTNRELRQLVLGKAREMEIPLDPVRLSIQGEGSGRMLSLSYNVLIPVPMFPTAVFNREFNHAVEYRIPR